MINREEVLSKLTYKINHDVFLWGQNIKINDIPYTQGENPIVLYKGANKPFLITNFRLYKLNPKNIFHYENYLLKDYSETQLKIRKECNLYTLKVYFEAKPLKKSILELTFSDFSTANACFELVQIIVDLLKEKEKLKFKQILNEECTKLLNEDFKRKLTLEEASKPYDTFMKYVNTLDSSNKISITGKLISNLSKKRNSA